MKKTTAVGNVGLTADGYIKWRKWYACSSDKRG
jgi:hypothetical protein